MKTGKLCLTVIISLGLASLVGGVLSQKEALAVSAGTEAYASSSAYVGRPLHFSDKVSNLFPKSDNTQTDYACVPSDFYMGVERDSEGVTFNLAYVGTFSSDTYVKICLHPTASTVITTENVYSKNPALTYDTLINIRYNEAEMLPHSALFFDYKISGSSAPISYSHSGKTIKVKFAYSQLLSIPNATTDFKVFAMQLTQAGNVPMLCGGNYSWYNAFVLNGNFCCDSAYITQWPSVSLLGSSNALIGKINQGHPINFGGVYSGTETNNMYAKVYRDSTKVYFDVVGIGTYADSSNAAHTSGTAKNWQVTIHSGTNGTSWNMGGTSIQLCTMKSSMTTDSSSLGWAAYATSGWGGEFGFHNSDMFLHDASNDTTYPVSSHNFATEYTSFTQSDGYFHFLTSIDRSYNAILDGDFSVMFNNWGGVRGRSLVNDSWPYSMSNYGIIKGDEAQQANYITIDSTELAVSEASNTYFTNYARTNGSLCSVLTNYSSSNALVTWFDGLAEGVKTKMATLVDYDCTIGETIAYARTTVAKGPSSGNMISLAEKDETSIWLIAIGAGLVAASIGYIFLRSKKRA